MLKCCALISSAPPPLWRVFLINQRQPPPHRAAHRAKYLQSKSNVNIERTIGVPTRMNMTCTRQLLQRLQGHSGSTPTTHTKNAYQMRMGFFGVWRTDLAVILRNPL